MESQSDESSVSSTEKAVAAAGALVGELVLDSPTSRASRPQRHMSKEDLEDLQMMTREQEGDEKSWMDRGFEWWKNRQEAQKREILQQKAEEQRRKIYEAEHQQENDHSLADNPVFQSVTGAVRHEEQEVDAGGLQVSKVHASKSGQGVSVDLTIPETEDKDFWTPSADIEEEIVTSHPFCPYLLEKKQRQSLCTLGAVPQSLCYSRWKRLYSLARDGDSFETFLRKVKGESHTILVIKTTRNDTFGGYADSAWEAQHQGNPEFYGSAQAALFRIDGDEARVFNWSGINRYIQFVDLKHKMLALGGGGAEGAFGLCVESDFQRGSTGPCATFQNEPLCSEENFEIVDVECYGFLTGTF